MNTYRTHGTCSQVINFEVENNIIKSVELLVAAPVIPRVLHDLLRVWISMMPYLALRVSDAECVLLHALTSLPLL